MRILFQRSKYTFLLTIMAFSWMNVWIAQSENMEPELSFTQQFQLDFIAQEIHRYPDLFINEWDSSSSAQLVIDSAELAVQNSPVSTKPIMKQRIIDLFAQINITIQFTHENLIIKIEPTKALDFDFKNTHHRYKLKKHRPQKITNNSKKLPELQKIKGAGRTLRRIKKKFKDQQEAQRQSELAEIRRKAALKDTIFRRPEQSETDNRIGFFRQKQAQEHKEYITTYQERKFHESTQYPHEHEIE